MSGQSATARARRTWAGGGVLVNRAADVDGALALATDLAAERQITEALLRPVHRGDQLAHERRFDLLPVHPALHGLPWPGLPRSATVAAVGSASLLRGLSI